MGGEHLVCFHANGIRDPCRFIHSDDDDYPFVAFTCRDRFVWRKIVIQLCLFAHSYEVPVKRFFYKDNKMIEMEDFELWWSSKDDKTTYNTMLEITNVLINVFPKKLCIYFDRYWYTPSTDEWFDYTFKLVATSTCTGGIDRYNEPLFELEDKLEDKLEKYHHLYHSMNKEFEVWRSENFGRIMSFFDITRLKWADTTIIPFNIKLCQQRRIILPIKLRLLLDVLPLDIVGLIGEYLYVIFTKN